MPPLYESTQPLTTFAFFDLPHPASICSAALFYQSLQWNIDVSELPLQTRDCHDMHATAMQTTEAPKEDARSTLVHQRAIASTHHADREAARTRNPTSRLQQQMTTRGPPPEPGFSRKKRGPENVYFYVSGFLFSDNFLARGSRGPFGPPEGPPPDGGGGKRGRPGN